MLAVPLPEAELRAAAGGRSCRWPRSTRPRCAWSPGPTDGGRGAARPCSRGAGVELPPAAHLARLPLRDDGAHPARPSARGVRAGARCAARSSPIVSNVTGTWITAEEATDPRYWARHLRRPVRFADGPARAARASPSASSWRSARATRWARWRGSAHRRRHRPRVLHVAARAPATPQDAALHLPETAGRLWLAGRVSTGRRSTATSPAAACPCPPTPSSASAMICCKGPRPPRRTRRMRSGPRWSGNRADGIPVHRSPTRMSRPATRRRSGWRGSGRSCSASSGWASPTTSSSWAGTRCWAAAPLPRPSAAPGGGAAARPLRLAHRGAVALALFEARAVEAALRPGGDAGELRAQS